MDLLSSVPNTERRKAIIPFIIVEITKALFGVGFYKLNKENLYLLSNIVFLVMHYTLDIFIAKETTNKMLFFKQSFTNTVFFKYIISFTISFITSESIVEYIDIIFKQNNFKLLKNEYYNKVIIRLVVNVIMNMLIYYYLKFKWALSDEKYPIIDMIVMCWVSLLILMFMILKSVNQMKSSKKYN
jgi:hypothetical protein